MVWIAATAGASVWATDAYKRDIQAFPATILSLSNQIGMYINVMFCPLWNLSNSQNDRFARNDLTNLGDYAMMFLGNPLGFYQVIKRWCDYETYRKIFDCHRVLFVGFMCHFSDFRYPIHRIREYVFIVLCSHRWYDFLGNGHHRPFSWSIIQSRFSRILRKKRDFDACFRISGVVFMKIYALL